MRFDMYSANPEQYEARREILDKQEQDIEKREDEARAKRGVEYNVLDFMRERRELTLHRGLLEARQTVGLLDKLKKGDSAAYDNAGLEEIRSSLESLRPQSRDDIRKVIKNAEQAYRGDRTASALARQMASFAESFDTQLIHAYAAVAKKATMDLAAKPLPPENTEARFLVESAKTHATAAAAILQGLSHGEQINQLNLE